MEVSQLTRDYPRKIKARGGQSVSLQRLSEDDRDRIVDFARGLDKEDLLFLRVDLTDPGIVDEIIRDQASDRRITLLAESDGEVVGYAGLSRRRLEWMRHLGEIRIIVGPESRSQGLGRLLVQELAEFKQAVADNGLCVPMATTNLFSTPAFKDGAFTANDPQVRAYALQKTMSAIDLGVELGAKVYVCWGGREGVESDASKDPVEALKRYREALNFLTGYWKDQVSQCRDATSRAIAA